MNNPWQQKIEQSELIGKLSKKQEVRFASACIRNMFDLMQGHLRENVDTQIILHLQTIILSLDKPKQVRTHLSEWRQLLLEVSEDERLDEISGWSHVISAVIGLFDLIDGTFDTDVLSVAEDCLYAVSALDDKQYPLRLPDNMTPEEAMRIVLTNPGWRPTEAHFPLVNEHVEFQIKVLEKIGREAKGDQNEWH